jgi:hypothetical protein
MLVLYSLGFILAAIVLYYALYYFTLALCWIASPSCFLWHAPSAAASITREVTLTNLNLNMPMQQPQKQPSPQRPSGPSFVSSQGHLPPSRLEPSPPPEPSFLSKMNPVNWFGSGDTAPPTTTVSNRDFGASKSLVPQQQPTMNAVCPACPVCAPPPMDMTNLAVADYYSKLVENYRKHIIGRHTSSSKASHVCFEELSTNNKFLRVTNFREMLIIADTCSFATPDEFLQKVSQNMLPFYKDLTEEFVLIVMNEL